MYVELHYILEGSSLHDQIMFITGSSPIAFKSGDVIYFDFEVPISQWDSPITLVQNYTEYASNDGSEGTSAAINYNTGMKYGMDGSRFVSVDGTQTTDKTTGYKVTFKSPILITDKITIETSENYGATWNTIGTTSLVCTTTYQASARYGMGFTPITGDSYSIYVLFGNGGRNSYSAYGAVS